MGIERGIYSLLTGDAGVAALLGTRVYPEVLPQNPSYPAITYQVVSGGSEYEMEGPANQASPRVQIDCYAESAEGAIALKGAVMAALSGYRGSVGSPPVAIQGAFRRSEGSGFEDGLRPAGLRVWRKTLDFEIWYEETY